MIYKDIIQGSDEWDSIRLGKATSSRMIDIIKGPRGYRASRINYLAEKVCEILTGQQQEHYHSKPMDGGHEFEALARSTYEGKTGNYVDEVGFIDHDTIQLFGASPDGLVNNDGCIEIKCPNSATHLLTLTKGTIKKDYILQMQAVMMCGNRQWCDFISFDPRIEERLSLYIKRFPRDEVMIAEITMEVEKFKSELTEMLKKLKEIK